MMPYLRTLILLISVLFAGIGGGNFNGKKVLILGIDGCTPAGLNNSNIKNLDLLKAEGSWTYDAYAGGELGKITETPTLSGPGWTSILTGVWANKHKVYSNNFGSYNYKDFPHMFSYIKDRNPESFLSSIAQWHPINNNILMPTKHAWDYMENTGSGKAEAEAVIKHLKENNPDVLFVHFNDVDTAGYYFGFETDTYHSTQYIQAIEDTDAHIGDILEALKQRLEEEWMIIVTTDHGGKGMHDHGGQSLSERTIFLIVNSAETTQGEIAPGPGLTSVPPTVFKYLGIPVSKDWGWESQPFGF